MRYNLITHNMSGGWLIQDTLNRTETIWYKNIQDALIADFSDSFSGSTGSYRILIVSFNNLDTLVKDYPELFI